MIYLLSKIIYKYRTKFEIFYNLFNNNIKIKWFNKTQKDIKYIDLVINKCLEKNIRKGNTVLEKGMQGTLTSKTFFFDCKKRTICTRYIYIYNTQQIIHIIKKDRIEHLLQ